MVFGTGVRATGEIGRGIWAALLVSVALAPACRPSEDDGGLSSRTPFSAGASHEGLLYGRVTTRDGDVVEGPLRFGGDGEVLWGEAFNGTKRGNPWVDDALRERLPKRLDSVSVLGVRVARFERELDLDRPFMARYGDIERIERSGNDLTVTLKGGAAVVLDRMAADDFGDGVRIWDGEGGFLDLGERQIRSIEFLPALAGGDGPHPLHGTLRTASGTFTGFIQWNRRQSVVSDALVGLTTDRNAFNLPFDTIGSIARRENGGVVVTLRDGQEFELPGLQANLGTYVDDPRYGRVLVSWDAFDRVDFSPGGTGPAYEDFPVGRTLRGSVTTRSGRRLTGRLVYDLDESETVETLDAPHEGVTYTIPFGLIDSVELPDDGPAEVTLWSGEALELERSGDLADDNGGMLVSVDGRADPEYVPWSDVERIDLDRPVATYPPSGA